MSQTIGLNLSQLLSNPLSFTNVLFVSKGGNDATALVAGKYDFHKQWLNPTVAMANAVSGDIVCVYAGVYTIGTGGDVTDDGLQYLVKDGVTLYVMDGTTIHYTNLTGVASTPFFDNGIASTFLIRGKGKFIFNRDITTSDTWQVTTHVDTTLDWEFDEIDIRRRFGTTGHDCVSWRMVGRKWLNRESMLFAFRFPIASANRKIYIQVEETEILEENVNNTWTRSEIRNFDSGSHAHIDLGEVKYPHAYNGGALFQKISCSADAIINFYANRAYKMNDNSIREYLIVGVSDSSNGIVDIKNINTSTGLSLYLGLGSLSSVKKTENYQGIIRLGYTGISIFTNSYFSQYTNIKTTLDILVDSISTTFFGVVTYNSPNVVISGRIVWHNLTNPPIQLNGSLNNHGRLENLIISEIDAAVPSVINLDSTIKDLRIMNVYATTAVSTLNGGVNQLIETIKVNSNI